MNGKAETADLLLCDITDTYPYPDHIGKAQTPSRRSFLQRVSKVIKDMSSCYLNSQ